MPLIKSQSPQAFSRNVAAERSAGRPRAQALAIAYDIQRRARQGMATGGTIPWPVFLYGAGILGQRGWQPRVGQGSRMQSQQGWDEAGFIPPNRQTVGKPDYSMPVRDDDDYAMGGGMPKYGMIHGPTPGRADAKSFGAAPGSYIVPADIVSGMGQGNSLNGANTLNRMLKMGPYGSAPARAPGAAPGVNRASLGIRQRFAKGGASRGDVPINISDGEFAIPPEKVAEIGQGDIDLGHDILDRMVQLQRQKTIQHLQTLPPPRGSEGETADPAMQGRGPAPLTMRENFNQNLGDIGDVVRDAVPKIKRGLGYQDGGTLAFDRLFDMDQPTDEQLSEVDSSLDTASKWKLPLDDLRNSYPAFHGAQPFRGIRARDSYWPYFSGGSVNARRGL